MVRTIVNAILVRNGAVLLARRSAHRAAYPELWSFPGGHVELGETLEAALVREVGEEIGVVPVMFSPLGTIANPNADPTDPVTYHFFAVQAWTGDEPYALGDEHSELGWFDLPTAPGLPDFWLSTGICSERRSASQKAVRFQTEAYPPVSRRRPLTARVRAERRSFPYLGC